MRKLLVIAIIVVVAYIVMQLAGYKPNNNELRTNSEDKVRREAIHKIDDLLLKRMTVVAQKNKEDILLLNQNKGLTMTNYQEVQLIVKYFQKRQEIMRDIKNEIEEGYKELNLLLSKYKDEKSIYQLIDAFRIYFYAYKDFMDTAFKDIEDKLYASNVIKTIALLESTEKELYAAIVDDDIQRAKKLLDRQEKLIMNYKNNIDKIDFKDKIPNEWKNDFIVTYVQMFKWDKKFYNLAKGNNEKTYNELSKEHSEIMRNIPYTKSNKFIEELQRTINNIPDEINRLQSLSAESGKKAYDLYILHKKNIGENPKEILDRF